MGDHEIKWGGKTLLDLDYADDLSILDESLSKMNEFLEFLWVQGARIGLEINVKKTESLKLGISEDEKVTLGNEKIYQVDSSTSFDSIKQFVVTNCSKERPGSIVTKTQKNGILIPIATSKESHFNADFEDTSFFKFSYTHQS